VSRGREKEGGREGLRECLPKRLVSKIRGP
jgi:hypothetical protein